MVGDFRTLNLTFGKEELVVCTLGEKNYFLFSSQVAVFSSWMVPCVPLTSKDQIMPRLPNFLRSQFQRNYLLFYGTDPVLFVSAEAFRQPTLLYAMYQTMLTIYLMFLSIYSGFASKHGVKVFIYFTYWTLYLSSLYHLLKTYHTWLFLYKYRDNKEKRPTELTTGIKIQWVLFNITSNGGIIVAILFWLVLYHPGKTSDFLGFNTHGVLAIIILTDMFISAMPVRLLHAWMGSVYATLFSIFCLLYWQAGGTNTKHKPYIYPIMDFSKNSGTAVLCIFVLVFLTGPLLHTALYGLYCLRRTIYNKAARQKNSNTPHNTIMCEECELQSKEPISAV